MARRKTLPDSVQAKFALAERLRMLRSELYGERGGPELARRLGLPIRTWYNYESGVTIPAEVVLKIIELTSVEPMWLLHGKGPKFRATSAEHRDAVGGPNVSVGSLLRTALHMLEQKETAQPALTVSRGASTTASDEHAEVVLLAVDESAAGGTLTKISGPRYVAARSEWIDAEKECRCIRIEGDAMSPIVADGACVAFAKSEEDPAHLDGKIVVAWVDGQPVVRWFQYCGRYGVLRAENPTTTPATILIDLDSKIRDPRFRRVLWIDTPH
jgi:SOS-response transcriptional repressor LexA